MWPFSRWRKRKQGIRPYGNVHDDGVVQLGFTLPVPADKKAREAARIFSQTLGLEDVEVVSMESVGPAFSAFVVYGKATCAVAYDKIEIAESTQPSLGFDDLNRFIKEKIRRPLVIVAATLESDAYAVGMDAIVSMQGVAGDCGLEAYPGFRVLHMRGSATHEDIVARAKNVRADVVLVAPQARVREHVKPLREFMQVVKTHVEFYKSVVPVCVGTHLTDKQARGLGYRATFAPKTLPSQVANFIVYQWVNSHTKSAQVVFTP